MTTDRPAPQKLILRMFLSPGDLMVLTAALESLHMDHPFRYVTDVRTSCPDLFKNNPLLTPIDYQDKESYKKIEVGYDRVNESGQSAVGFLEAMLASISAELGHPIRVLCRRPMVVLDNEDYAWRDEQFLNLYKPQLPYVVFSPGVKRDCTVKGWPTEYYQQVIDHFKGRLLFVQIGQKPSERFFSPPLLGVINMVDSTTQRQLLALCSTAFAGLGPITFLCHAMAWAEKPYVCLNGGREPVTWLTYPKLHMLHTIGARHLPCCSQYPCWRSRVVPLKPPEQFGPDGPEGEARWQASLCDHPLTVGWQRPVPQCMADIKPQAVIDVLERYLR